MIERTQAVRLRGRRRGGAAILGLTIVALIALAGCRAAPVPSEALTTADLAVARARTAGAAQHAAVEFARAEAKLEAAHAAVQSRDHERARTLAEQALVDAELAELKAQAAQAEAGTRRLRERVDLQNRKLALGENGV